jgi:hypothetical protein
MNHLNYLINNLSSFGLLKGLNGNPAIWFLLDYFGFWKTYIIKLISFAFQTQHVLLTHRLMSTFKYKCLKKCCISDLKYSSIKFGIGWNMNFFYTKVFRGKPFFCLNNNICHFPIHTFDIKLFFVWSCWALTEYKTSTTFGTPK